MYRWVPEEKRAYFTLEIWIAFFVVGIPRLCALDATVAKSIRARKAYNDLHSPLATHKKIVVDVTYANTQSMPWIRLITLLVEEFRRANGINL